jgi:chromosome segregation ATPase
LDKEIDMWGQLMRRSAVIGLAVFVIVGLLLIDTNAQKRKRRRRSSAPRITNPEIYQPATNENSNSNNSTETSLNENANASPSPTDDPEAMKKTIRTLSDQVDRLNNKLNSMEESQKSLVDLERLSRAEQRSAQFRSELLQVQAKKADLEGHLENVEYALKPENIERSIAGYGTTHPEDLREQRRRQLEGERDRGRKQLEQLTLNEDRLQQAIATSDAEVDRLQKKMDEADRVAIENAKQKSQEPPLQPAASPTPTPNR